MFYIRTNKDIFPVDLIVHISGMVNILISSDDHISSDDLNVIKGRYEA